MLETGDMETTERAEIVMRLTALRARLKALDADRAVQRVAAAAELPNSHWSKAAVLRALPNPGCSAYEQRIRVPEFTFLGSPGQPDFGELDIVFYPDRLTPELKSLKAYKDAFRDVSVSYERLLNVIYDDIMTVYAPRRLRMTLRMQPRGGISSTLVVDSDWSVRGGSEEFGDWRGSPE